jgi:hypothetical protein
VRRKGRSGPTRNENSWRRSARRFHAYINIFSKSMFSGIAVSSCPQLAQLTGGAGDVPVQTELPPPLSTWKAPPVVVSLPASPSPRLCLWVAPVCLSPCPSVAAAALSLSLSLFALCRSFFGSIRWPFFEGQRSAARAAHTRDAQSTARERNVEEGREGGDRCKCDCRFGCSSSRSRDQAQWVRQQKNTQNRQKTKRLSGLHWRRSQHEGGSGREQWSTLDVHTITERSLCAIRIFL